MQDFFKIVMKNFYTVVLILLLKKISALLPILRVTEPPVLQLILGSRKLVTDCTDL